jgi:hypothetical protein
VFSAVAEQGAVVLAQVSVPTVAPSSAWCSTSMV